MFARMLFGLVIGMLMMRPRGQRPTNPHPRTGPRTTPSGGPRTDPPKPTHTPDSCPSDRVPRRPSPTRSNGSVPVEQIREALSHIGNKISGGIIRGGIIGR